MSKTSAHPMSPEAREMPSSDPVRVGAMLRRALLAVALVIFVVEFFLMRALGFVPGLGVQAGALLDAALCAGALVPLLLLWFVRPTIRAARGWADAERALRQARDELAARVEARTAELAEANRALRLEMHERRQADRTIRHQAGLLGAVRQAVVATDAEGRVTFVNQFAVGLLGVSAAEVHGRPLSDIPRLAVFRTTGGCGDPLAVPAEVEIARPDGTAFPAVVSCSVIAEPGGEPEGYLYLATDVTALKRAEEDLSYSEAKYSTLVEHAPTGIFIARDGKIVFVNPRFLEIAGFPKERIGTVALADMLHPEDPPLPEVMDPLDLPGNERECRIVRPTGEARWVSANAAPIRYRDRVSVIWNVQDITDRKEMEGKLQRSREAMRRLSRRLLTAHEDERRRVARDLHDSIGQNLSFVHLMIDDVLGQPWPEERRTQALVLRSLLPQLQEAIDEVRRIFMALRPPILDDLGLLAASDWLLRQFEKVAPGLEVRQDLRVTEEEIPAELKIVLFRILQEAVSNVAKHSHAARLEVELVLEDGELRLTLADDGVGFDSGAAAPGGDPRTGVGLSSMLERAELSGGTLSVRSAPGRGTTVEAGWRLDGDEVSALPGPS